MSKSAGAPKPISILAEVAALQQAGQRGVLATPLWSTGSVPLSAHSKLLVREDGSMAGTIGGGPLEARALVIARDVLSSGQAQLLEFELTQDEAAESGMICGGRCLVLLEPVSPDRAAELYARVARAEAEGEPVVLVTLLPSPDRLQKLALLSEGTAVGELAEAPQAEFIQATAKRVLDEGQPRFFEQPIRAHFDPLLPRPHAYIFGAGHVAIPVAHLAALVGFRVVVIDDRAEFANRERFPRADDVVVASVPDAFAALPVDEESYVIAVTRGHAMDEEAVAGALGTPARYVGMIGSKRKVAAVLERLRGRGFSDEDLARVHAPIGLDIGADTVEEIAVSIVAELIAGRRKS
ncbi:MAG: XdhC family protein [Armatimonadetes bacterium]|nr:XdhC family protein [Armatimonadota bacterium]